MNENRSSGTIVGWKSGQTTYFLLWDRMKGSWLWTLDLRICDWRIMNWKKLKNRDGMFLAALFFVTIQFFR
jgi:hypothetical protein